MAIKKTAKKVAKKNVRTKKATAAYVAKMADVRERREKWLTALESGRYKQTTEQLRRTLDKKNYGYCCLGVLCNIEKEKGQKWDGEIFLAGNYVQYNGESEVDVMDEYMELPPLNILKKLNITEGLANTLAGMNDRGTSFKEIAKFLRKKWRMPKN